MLWPVACMTSYYNSYAVASGVHDVKCRVMLWSVACMTSNIELCSDKISSLSLDDNIKMAATEIEWECVD